MKNHVISSWYGTRKKYILGWNRSQLDVSMRPISPHKQWFISTASDEILPSRIGNYNRFRVWKQNIPKNEAIWIQRNVMSSQPASQNRYWVYPPTCWTRKTPIKWPLMKWENRRPTPDWQGIMNMITWWDGKQRTRHVLIVWLIGGCLILNRRVTSSSQVPRVMTLHSFLKFAQKFQGQLNSITPPPQPER